MDLRSIKPEDYFLTLFESSLLFGAAGGKTENWIELAHTRETHCSLRFLCVLNIHIIASGHLC